MKEIVLTSYRDLPGAIWKVADETLPSRTLAVVMYPLLVVIALAMLTVRAISAYLPGTLRWHERRNANRQRAIKAELSVGWTPELRIGQAYRATCDEVDMTRDGENVRLSGLMDIAVIDEDGVGIAKIPFVWSFSAQVIPGEQPPAKVSGDVSALPDGTVAISDVEMRFTR